jgi:hypothetical protein
MHLRIIILAVWHCGNIILINPEVFPSPILGLVRLSNQQQGKTTQAQQDAFKNNHPACVVFW